MLVDMGRALYEGLVALIILIAGIAFGLGVLACSRNSGTGSFPSYTGRPREKRPRSAGVAV